MARRKRKQTKPDAVQPESGQELSQEELQAQAGAALPDREAMSLINANVAIPINAAIAANVLSDGAQAYAEAVQGTPINQNATPTAPTTPTS